MKKMTLILLTVLSILLMQSSLVHAQVVIRDSVAVLGRSGRFSFITSTEEMETFINRSREYTDGWMSFYWGKTIEENESKRDLKGAVVAQWLRTFRKMSPVSNCVN